ncbi:MAG TPA: DUF1326 domain-containing protein [Acidobacteriota bacterium]|nr:DUF1326 domain-containing protein [Acidobacteriota bacterium]
MRLSARLLSIVGSFVLLSGSALAAQIYGDYVESRTSDVWTGPCFANGEVGLTGQQATMAWKIRKGTWDGIVLDGLSVVAVTKASATLGDPYSDPFPAKSVLIVDEKATDRQKRALEAFAKSMAGRLLENVILVQPAPITLQFGDEDNHGSVILKAGNLASVTTRALNGKDHFCGNEYTYYPPLTELSHAMPAVAMDNEFNSNALGSEWRLFDKRSAFVGTFAR